MRKNIIYLHTHDSGRYWSPYGYNVPTPNLMDFASECTLFRQCYSSAPTCSPSRACLLTGMTPHESGMQGLASRGWQLNDYRCHMARYLGSYGYHTVLCGIQHEAPDYHMIGYSEVIGSQDFSMDRTEASMEDWDYANTDAAVSFISSYDGNEPLFLSVGLFNTHREYPKAKNDINPDYIQPPAVLYDCAKTREDMADYMESARVAGSSCCNMGRRVSGPVFPSFWPLRTSSSMASRMRSVMALMWGTLSTLSSRRSMRPVG